MTPDEFKKLIATIGGLIDKRAETTETNIKMHVDTAIQASEERVSAKIDAARAEAKVDILQLQGKLDKVIKGQERRLDNLEKHTGTTNPNKN